MKKAQTVVSDFQERINDLKAVTVNDESAESASQSEARRDSDIELMSTLADQLDFATREVETLQGMELDGDEHTAVTFGSVVHTDQRNFLVGISIDNFEVDGKEYWGISPRAPLYKVLEGATAGSSISFNGVDYKVQQVF